MGKEQDLLDAARTGNVAIIEKLLSNRTRKSSGGGALTTALASLWNLKSVNVNCTDGSGETPLHLAALNGHREIVSILLQGESNPCAVDTRGCSPLHLAAWSGNSDICYMLLTQATPPATSTVNLQNGDGDTPLHCAAQHGHATTVAILLQNKADPAIRNLGDLTPLELAAQYGRLDVVHHLINTHPGLVHIVVPSHTPLHLASRSGHRSVVEYLLNSGIQVNLKTDAGTALHEAATYCKIDVIQLLLERGIDVNIRDKSSLSAEDILKTLPSQKAYDAQQLIENYHSRHMNAFDTVHTPDSDTAFSPADTPESSPLKKPTPQVSVDVEDMYTKPVKDRINTADDTNHDRLSDVESPPPPPLPPRMPSIKTSTTSSRNQPHISISSSSDSCFESVCNTPPPNKEVPSVVPKSGYVPMGTIFPEATPGVKLEHPKKPPRQRKTQSPNPDNTSIKSHSPSVKSDELSVSTTDSLDPSTELEMRSYLSDTPSDSDTLYANSEEIALAAAREKMRSDDTLAATPNSRRKKPDSKSDKPARPVAKSRNLKKSEKESDHDDSSSKHAQRIPDYCNVVIGTGGGVSIYQDGEMINVVRNNITSTDQENSTLTESQNNVNNNTTAREPLHNITDELKEPQQITDNSTSKEPQKIITNKSIHKDCQNITTSESTQKDSRNLATSDSTSIELQNATCSDVNAADFHSKNQVTSIDKEHNKTADVSDIEPKITPNDGQKAAKNSVAVTESNEHTSKEPQKITSKEPTSNEPKNITRNESTSKESPMKPVGISQKEPQSTTTTIDKTVIKDKEQVELRGGERGSKPISLDLDQQSRRRSEGGTELPMSPTGYIQPPTPDQPPPSPSTALYGIQQKLNPQEKRKSKDMETLTEAALLLPGGLPDIPEQLNSHRNDREEGRRKGDKPVVTMRRPQSSLGTGSVSDSEVELNMFAGLLRGSAPGGSRSVVSQICENVSIKRVKTNRRSAPSSFFTFDPLMEKEEEKDIDTEEVIAAIDAITTDGKTASHKASKSDDSVFDDAEEWNKIAATLATFGAGLARESVFVKEYEADFARLLAGSDGIHSVGEWLDIIGLGQYENTLIANGFDDTDFLGNNILEDSELEAIGIKNTEHRKKILDSSKLLPALKPIDQNNLPASVEEWLKSLRLAEYWDTFRIHGYSTMERVVKLWELELSTVLDISSVGHRRRILASLGDRPLPEVKEINQTPPTLVIDAVRDKPSPFEHIDLYKDYTGVTSRLSDESDDTSQNPDPLTDELESDDGSKQSQSIKDSTIHIRPPHLAHTTGAIRQWRHRPDVLIKGCCNYTSQYLGSTLVKELNGPESTQEGIAKLKKSTQVIAKIPTIILSISYRGVKFIDAKSKKVICDHEIANIFCACQDSEHMNFFAYITKDRETGKHYCHVFSVRSRELAGEIILTLGEAFEIAYQMALKEKAEEDAFDFELKLSQSDVDDSTSISSKASISTV